MQQRAEATIKGVDELLEDMPRPDDNKMGYLGVMQGLQTYAGTVDPETVRKRRAKNKTARKSRRANRK